MIHTVCGEISRKDLGFTYCHEHLVMDLRHVRNDSDSMLYPSDELMKELHDVKQMGLSTIVEVSNYGMGRNALHLKKISEETGVQIVASTGFYQSKYHPKWLKEATIAEVEEYLLNEWRNGLDNTHVKPGIIAEIGTSLNKITETERKVMLAASKVHGSTGLGISTHTEMGTMAMDQVRLLLGSGVDPSRLVIGHMDLQENIDIHLNVLKSGATVAFDTIGKQGYRNDTDRVSHILRLLDKGFESQIVLSQDVTRQSHLKTNGGIGFTYLIDVFISRLKANGVPGSLIRKMTSENMGRILDVPKHG